MEILRDLYAKASKDERTDVPLSELRVGLKYGGSDGFSGITANPLLGMFSDFLIAQGGTSVLTEVPEMFGAETILMNCCKNEELFEQTVHLINDFKEYFLSHGEPVGENPSPGNKAGGISTLEEKALGCTQKCGKSYVSGVMPEKPSEPPHFNPKRSSDKGTSVRSSLEAFAYKSRRISIPSSYSSPTF